MTLADRQGDGPRRSRGHATDCYPEDLTFFDLQLQFHRGRRPVLREALENGPAIPRSCATDRTRAHARARVARFSGPENRARAERLDRAFPVPGGGAAPDGARGTVDLEGNTIPEVPSSLPVRRLPHSEPEPAGVRRGLTSGAVRTPGEKDADGGRATVSRADVGNWHGCRRRAPFHPVIDPPRSGEKFGGTWLLGRPPDLEAKAKGDSSMVGKRERSEGAYGRDSRDPRDTVKAGLILPGKWAAGPRWASPIFGIRSGAPRARRDCWRIRLPCPRRVSGRQSPMLALNTYVAPSAANLP